MKTCKECKNQYAPDKLTLQLIGGEERHYVIQVKAECGVCGCFLQFKKCTSELTTKLQAAFLKIKLK